MWTTYQGIGNIIKVSCKSQDSSKFQKFKERKTLVLADISIKYGWEENALFQESSVGSLSAKQWNRDKSIEWKDTPVIMGDVRDQLKTSWKKPIIKQFQETFQWESCQWGTWICWRLSSQILIVICNAHPNHVKPRQMIKMWFSTSWKYYRISSIE